ELVRQRRRDEAEVGVRHYVYEGSHVNDVRPRALLLGELEPELDSLMPRIRAVGCDQDLVHGGLLRSRPSSANGLAGASGRPPICRAVNYGLRDPRSSRCRSSEPPRRSPQTRKEGQWSTIRKAAPQGSSTRPAPGPPGPRLRCLAVSPT